MKACTSRDIAFIVAVLVSWCFVSGTPAKAETSKDLKALYDEEIVADFESLLENCKSIQNEIELEKDTLLTQEDYNSFITLAEDYWTEYSGQVKSQANEIIARNIEINESVKSSFYGDIGVLLSLDAEYKSNEVKVNEMLSNLDNVVISEKYEIDRSKLASLLSDLSNAESQYNKAAEGAVELGDVTNFKWPLACETRVCSKYGSRIDPILKTVVSFHKGVDLDADEGTPVLAAFNGKVLSTSWSDIAGYEVWIDHGDGIKTYYCHLKEFKCKPGQIVKQYDTVALSGNTGSRTTGPHLHFSMQIDGGRVDPGIVGNQ